MADLLALVRSRCAPPGWALFEELKDHPTNNRCRADAVAMSLWPGRGIALHGFELKNSRSDWLRELKDVVKGEPIQKFCDQWWVVAQPNVVTLDELPYNWGLLVPDANGKRLIAKRQAPKLKAAPFTREFVAAILRRVSQERARLLLKEYNRGHRDGQLEGPEETSKHIRRLEERVEDLTRAISDFEKASGVEIHAYQGKNIGEAFKLVRSHYYSSWKQLEEFRKKTLEANRRIVAAIDEEIALSKALHEDGLCPTNPEPNSPQTSSSASTSDPR